MDFNINDKFAAPFSNSGIAQDASPFGKGSRAAEGFSPDGIGKAGRTAEGFSPDGIGKAEKANATGEDKKAGGKSSPQDCETCKNRKYQDGSDESDVSFQTATHIDPSAAGAKVRAHEQEHVSNAYSKAAEAGGKVISVGVSIHTAVCPECGRTYVSGGVTHSVIAYPQENGAPKIESTNGDPDKAPDSGSEGADSKGSGSKGAASKGAGSRTGRQDFTIDMPATATGSTADAGTSAPSAGRTDGASAVAAGRAANTASAPSAGRATNTASAPSAGRTASARSTSAAPRRMPQINPYAAAQKAAEARRSTGAIFRTRV